MNRRDTIQMMARCKDEITLQRKEREILAPKAEAYDLIKQILGLLPQQQRGYGEDIVYKLERAILEEAKAEEEERQAAMTRLVEPQEVNADEPK